MLNKEKPVEITFDNQKCTKCGLCAKVCPGEYIQQINGELTINKDSLFGCVQCGHCMMSCPHDAVFVTGEGISPSDLVERSKNHTDYNSLYSLLINRRSIRKFKDEAISNESIEKILSAASTGAISLPPYEVKVLVINGKDKVQILAEDIVNSLGKMTKIMNSFTLSLLKPFIGQQNHKIMKEFVLPLVKETVEQRSKGNDILFYNAPCVILFYTTELSDKEDALIAATLATTAAQTLGLGTCVIGSVPPALNNNKKLKEKYGMNNSEKVQSAFIMGYPQKSFLKNIKRRFKDVRYY